MAKQLDADLKKLLTKQDAQEALTEMQMSAAEFERQAGSLSAGDSSACKELTERTQKAVTMISENGERAISTVAQEAKKNCMIPIPAGNTYSKKEVDSISTQRKPAPEQAKKELAEQLWLSYYNQVLFEAGLITEAERNRMKNKISALAPSASNEVGRSIQA